MNILHSPDLNNKHHISLGLVRLEGSATAMKCANILEKQLHEFDLSLEDDVDGLTTDRAAVMDGENGEMFTHISSTVLCTWHTFGSIRCTQKIR